MTKTSVVYLEMPRLGETMEHGTIVTWLKQPGQAFVRGEPLLEIETDKIVAEYPALVAGTLLEILSPKDSVVKVAAPIARIEVNTLNTSPGFVSKTTSTTSETTSRVIKHEVSNHSTTRQRATPVARKLAKAKGIDLANIPGTGRRGRVEKMDVLNYAIPAQLQKSFSLAAAPSVRRRAREMGLNLTQNPISATNLTNSPPITSPQVTQQTLPDFSKWGEVERVAMNGIRKATVRSMTNAWSNVPMVTQFDKADLTQFEATRKKFQPKAEALGAKITPTAMLLKIVASALKRFPDFNSSLDTAKQEIIRKKYVNIGVAVDTENGLLVPVIKNADQKSVIELAKELSDLAAKARARKLSPDEMSGGNFSISNLGGIGGTGFTPIVNPPDVGILGVSRGSMEPVWNASTGSFEPKMMMPLSVSYDHRLIDGAGAARFLRWICEAIEEPFLLLLQ